jgi:hypothetical protein
MYLTTQSTAKDATKTRETRDSHLFLCQYTDGGLVQSANYGTGAGSVSYSVGQYDGQGRVRQDTQTENGVILSNSYVYNVVAQHAVGQYLINTIMDFRIFFNVIDE